MKTPVFFLFVLLGAIHADDVTTIESNEKPELYVLAMAVERNLPIDSIPVDMSYDDREDVIEFITEYADRYMGLVVSGWYYAKKLETESALLCFDEAYRIEKSGYEHAKNLTTIENVKALYVMCILSVWNKEGKSEEFERALTIYPDFFEVYSEHTTAYALYLSRLFKENEVEKFKKGLAYARKLSFDENSVKLLNKIVARLNQIIGPTAKVEKFSVQQHPRGDDSLRMTEPSGGINSEAVPLRDTP